MYITSRYNVFEPCNSLISDSYNDLCFTLRADPSNYGYVLFGCIRGMVASTVGFGD